MRKAITGQAVAEFAIVAPMFFLCLFGLVSSLLYTFERSMVVAAVTTGARSAASATAGDPNRTAFDGAVNQTVTLMRTSLVGTDIQAVDCSAGTPIPAQGQVFVCWRQYASGMVAIRAYGYPPNFFGSFGLNPLIDIKAITHTVEYQS